MSTKDGHLQALAMTLSRKAVMASSLAVFAAITVQFKVWGALVTDDALGIVRSQLAFTGGRFTDVIQTWDVAEFVRLTATLDFVYPIAYGTAIAAVWARAAGPDLRPGSSWPLTAAFGAAAADWLENIFHLLAIEPAITGGAPNSAAVAVGSVFATVKWMAIVAAMLGTARAAWMRGGWRWRLTGAAFLALAGAVSGLVLTAAA